MSAARSSKCSTGKSENDALISPSTMHFCLQGQPAPQCVRVRPRPKVRPVQPPNSPSNSQIKIQPPPLPIDKIMLVRERLLRDRATIGETERPSSSPLPSPSPSPSSSSSSSSPSAVAAVAVASQLSSPFNLAIDLSSLNNSEHETEDESECSPKPKQNLNIDWQRTIHSETSSSERFSPPPSQYFTQHCMKCSKLSTPSYPTTKSTQRSLACITDLPTDNNGDTDETRSRSSDLIYLYMDTLQNRNQLSKYFRLCGNCNEACCICLPRDEPAPSGRSSRCSEFSHFLIERMRNSPGKVSDSGTSTMHSTEATPTTDQSTASHNVSLSIMQLATAAQCARILADSLDSMLKMVREEITAGASPSLLGLLKKSDMESLTVAMDAINNLRVNDNEEGGDTGEIGKEK